MRYIFTLALLLCFQSAGAQSFQAETRDDQEWYRLLEQQYRDQQQQWEFQERAEQQWRDTEQRQEKAREEREDQFRILRKFPRMTR